MNYTLNHKEEEVMQILWKLQKAFVKDIIDDMPEPKPPYNTISSIVRKLESEGIVGYEAFGKTHRYFPILKQKKYKKHAFKNLLNNYFENSHRELLSYFVREEKLTEEEVKDLLESIKSNKS